MSATVTDHRLDIPSLGEDEVCHIRVEPSTFETVCGAPYNCATADTEGVWKGEETCIDCARLLCPECRQIASRELAED